MSTNTRAGSGGRWTWLLLAAVAIALGRLAWSVTHRAPAPGATSATAGHAEGTLAWVAIADAGQRASSTGRPVLYDFNAAWCGPCQMLDREVFTDAARSRAIAAQVVPVSVVDRQREDGRNPAEVDALQQRFQIEAFPTLIVLSPATGRFEKSEGYMGADATVEWIARSARSVGTGAPGR